MAQYNSYPAITEILAADIILVYKSSVGAIKTISATNFSASIKALTSRALTISVLNSSTVLSSQQFVVANSASTFTITLPDSTDNPGAPIYISNKGAGTITISASAGNTIFGAASVALTQFKASIFIPDGLGMWHVFGITT